MQQHEIYERARLSRDARFDGQFYVGVKTTGIYCRPVCPAVAPKSENVSFYPSAAAAARAGFRPCLRCRPECAPGTPAWNGTSTTVQRGLRLISGGALDGGSIEDLADRLGVTSRHMRRLFTQHLGASPLTVAHTQRLHFAKRLIDQTSMPMSQVASAAGYGSVRRFNDAFRKTYGKSPRELRRHNEGHLDDDAALAVRLTYSKPLNWRSLLEFLDARATPGVEAVAGGTYRRTVLVNGQVGVIECKHDDARQSVKLLLHGVPTPQVFQVVQRVREMLDLDAPVARIDDFLSRAKRLAAIVRHHPGIRVPGAWCGFELAVRAILGQQVWVKGAKTLTGRLAKRYGESIRLPPSVTATNQLTRLFPAPGRLARARFNDMGIVTSRIGRIRALSRAVLNGEVDFETAQDPSEFRQRLTGIRGIGDWTAEYIAMRALKNPDAFPASDLGLLKAVGDEISRPAELKRHSESWRPWRAYAAMLLWNSSPGPGG